MRAYMNIWQLGCFFEPPKTKESVLSYCETAICRSRFQVGLVRQRSKVGRALAAVTTVVQLEAYVEASRVGSYIVTGNDLLAAIRGLWRVGCGCSRNRRSRW